MRVVGPGKGGGGGSTRASPAAPITPEKCHDAGVTTTSPNPKGPNRPSFAGPLKIPSVRAADVVFSARCRRLYSNAHAYHINSLSVNSDCETYIRCDIIHRALFF
jgi:serine/threonine-protein phosphatase 2A regulatory subunit B